METENEGAWVTNMCIPREPGVPAIHVGVGDVPTRTSPHFYNRSRMYIHGSKSRHAKLESGRMISKNGGHVAESWLAPFKVLKGIISFDNCGLDSYLNIRRR